MLITNSYVFLRKEEELKKDKDGNYYIVLKTSLSDTFKKIFNATDNNLTLEEIKDNNVHVEKRLQDLFYRIIRGTFKLNINDKAMEIKYKFIVVNSTHYLDIIIETNQKASAIPFLEHINSILLKEDSKDLKDYIVIPSYDYVSEYYCDKIYPKLNSFERKLRKLLYLIYTSQFEKEYFKKTTSEEFQKKVKEKIQTKTNNKRKKEIDQIKNFFYYLDFGTLQEFLFEKRWTDLEVADVNEFLDDNADLSKVTDKELREMISNIRPKSDWERFFENKKLSENMEDTIKQIGKLRNIVAHNKMFNKEQFECLKVLLIDTSKILDEAIAITESKDFIDINTEKFEKSMKDIRNRLSKFIQSVADSMSPVREAFADLRKQYQQLNK
ncbi:MAG: hypothetical protein IJN90_05015 [Bacilli bacterium]|nr:hypothetical protein [Bacilli bacterium]